MADSRYEVCGQGSAGYPSGSDTRQYANQNVEAEPHGPATCSAMADTSKKMVRILLEKLERLSIGVYGQSPSGSDADGPPQPNSLGNKLYDTVNGLSECHKLVDRLIDNLGV